MGARSSKVSQVDEAILQLKLQRDQLKQYQRKLDIVLVKATEVAYKYIKEGNKHKALLALRQKKYQSGLLKDTDAHLESLESLLSHIEFAQIEQNVIYGLEQGNTVLKSLHKELSIERVERIMDDTTEGIAYQKELSDMLSSNISTEDEQEAYAEYLRLLDAQSDHETGEQQHSENIAGTFPEVPTDLGTLEKPHMARIGRKAEAAILS